MPCLTLNSPIEKLVTNHGDNINVSLVVILFHQFAKYSRTIYLCKAYLDFNMTDVKEIFLEVHERGQSFMNNKWGWDTNIALLTSGKFITKEYKVFLEIIFMPQNIIG